ncbi:oxysterol-binding protein-related protein 7-like isoform 5-T5 [Salvelinus alpinus]|uniref:oxysterol-binding protein-related protein 7 isoform X4 n=1 Tax=Salvelinus sp. IW2-2015 TaxID=2691554 RepID=UPI000CDFAB5D|nr:oxysterol-binding protein-related protein 7 isoform X4 [Salvelinus alpinus]
MGGSKLEGCLRFRDVKTSLLSRWPPTWIIHGCQSCVSSSEGTFPKSRLTFSDVVHPIVTMDPRVCPPSLNSSQSVMSSLDKSPAGVSKVGHSRNGSVGSSRNSRQVHSAHWEVLDDHMDMGSGIGSGLDMSVPGICEGFLMKRRKYPMKGWHKRYFLLEKGILKYSKTQQDIQRGKLHGSLDVSLAVMSINKKSKRIDLDSGDYLYHLKTKSNDLFYIWLTKLCAHRVFKKNEALGVHHGVLHALTMGNSTLLPAMASLAQRNQAAMPGMAEMEVSPTAAPGVNGKVAAWLQQTHQSDTCSQELARSQADLTELAQLIQRLNWLESGQKPISNSDLERRINLQNLTLNIPKAKKERKTTNKIFGHSRTHSGVETCGMFTSSHLSTSSNHLSVGASSVPSIPDYVYSQLSNPLITSPEAKKIQQEICAVSHKVHASLKSIHEVLALERERVRQAWTGPDLRSSTSNQLATLCSTLSELEVQSCQTKVHSLSLSSGSTGGSKESYSTVRQDQNAEKTPSKGCSVQRTPSLADSMAEYYDARDVIVCENSEDGEEESDESGLSDITTTSNSEPDEVHASTLPAEAVSPDQLQTKASATLNYRTSVSRAPDMVSTVPTNTGRRTVLPANCVDNSHIGIMTILYNNIGKDLSRVSMPCGLNEPLSLLQRVSEELEYSELLDIANRTEDPFERMLYIGVFSISGYAWATWRNRYKPFNPVLGETYESHRKERGFRYVAEQVSHHPPCSAVHAESENFTFWQDQQWKNKFWGKSLEIISSGPVNVKLPKYGDHYEWNKAVTCVHNVLSQQRWLEHYGEVTIRNTKSDLCTCKISFVKSRYWTSETSKNEVQGQVLNQAGEVVHQFGGLWHEGIFCDTLPNPKCIWKPNPQPDDHFQYYGFGRYARELNELTPELKKVLPPSDTRYRPDQRILEEGDVAGADSKKEEVEQKQRDRRKELAKKGEAHVPRFFRKELDAAGNESWLSNGTYWKIRDQPGFANTKNLDLWG